MNVRVREASRADAKTLLAIHQAAALARYGIVFPPSKHPFPVEAVGKRWRDFFDGEDNVALVAEVDGRAVGMVATTPGWLDALYVLPDAWGRGIGSRLHDEAVERLRATGCAEVRLWVLERNEAARRFYEQRGWRLDGRRRSVSSPPFPVDVGYVLPLR